MATRFYGRESGSAPVSVAVDAGWESSASPFASTPMFITTDGGDTLATATGFTSTTGQDRCHRQWIGERMAAGLVFDTSVTYKAQAQCLESAANDNLHTRIGVRIVSSDGSTVRHTVLAIAELGPTTEIFGNLRNKTFLDGDAGTGSYTTVAGDRLVVEWGHSDNSGTSISGSSRWGSSGTDLGENETDTGTTLNPWFETSLTVVFQDRRGVVTWAELEVPDQSRRGVVTWAEVEVPEQSRRGVVTWAELEVPDAPATDRRGVITWAEFEVPEQSRRGVVTWAELEVPNEPRRGVVTWAELEVPDQSRRGIVGWAELEVPNEPRRGVVTWAELEVPGEPRRAVVTWAELEVPDLASTGYFFTIFADEYFPTGYWPGAFDATLNTDRRGVVTWAEFEVPDQSRRGIVGWAELEVPNEPRRGIVTWAELEVPEQSRRGVLTWAELEVPEQSRRGIVTWAELEVPTGAVVSLLSLGIVELTDGFYGLSDTSATYFTCTDSTTTRWAIALGMEAVVTTSSSYLWLTEDQEFEVTLTRKNATTGLTEAATGLTGLSFAISATKGGAAIGSLTFNAAERGTTGIYAVTADTATLTTGLTTSAYPENSSVYLVLTKTGDVASRSWKKIVRRQREGDG